MRPERFCHNLGGIVFEGVGPYQIPPIAPEKWEPGVEFIGFNYATGEDKEHRGTKGVHFFLDDEQFERVWRQWRRYGEILSDFAAVMTPDFSMFTDWPVAVQIYNHYRKHFVGAYLQMLGVKVYPTICWSDEKSYEWCFDGEPVEGCVAVSSVGTQKGRESKRLFLSGYEAMLDKLKPETVIFYGNIPKECTGNIVRIRAFQERFKEAKLNGW